MDAIVHERERFAIRHEEARFDRLAEGGLDLPRQLPPKRRQCGNICNIPEARKSPECLATLDGEPAEFGGHELSDVVSNAFGTYLVDSPLPSAAFRVEGEQMFLCQLLDELDGEEWISSRFLVNPLCQ